MWADITQGNYLYNVGSWLTDNFSQKDNPCNVVSIRLGEHFIGTWHTKCCPNMAEISHRKSGNLTATILDHLPQFRIVPHTVPNSKNNIFERDW